jgi:hypothetical protein
MWRNPLPIFTPRLAALAQRPIPAVSRGVSAPGPVRRRNASRAIQGLRSVARHCTVAPRAQRFEVLLCDRACAVRTDLLRVAALVEFAVEPDAATIRTLRWLLTDGCASPLYNRAVPADRLHQVLEDAASALDAGDRRVVF